jgi:hypothetical protein
MRLVSDIVVVTLVMFEWRGVVMLYVGRMRWLVRE